MKCMKMKKSIFSALFLCAISLNAQTLDYTKAPNSYVFDPYQNTADGLYIPVKKAYKMWSEGAHMGGTTLPAGAITADVLWEDNHGLIKSGVNYALEITGAGEDAKIKVPINKVKEGNAVIALKVNGIVYWSWHVWVTDNPTNGTNYRSYNNLRKQKTDGTLEPIPESDWGWMDRNLGALTNSNTQGDFTKSGGLLYQWGRKDPIPPLALKGTDFYEVSGSIGRVRHRGSINTTGSVKIDNLIIPVKVSLANVKDNIRLAVNNPLSIIYVDENNNPVQAVYDNKSGLHYNWFGESSDFPRQRLGELNLWSDNSMGTIINTGSSTQNYHNYNSNARPYRNKSSYDPCPNGWRIPSMLIANISNWDYTDNVRLDYSPFGLKDDATTKDAFIAANNHIVKPNDTNIPAKLKGLKVYGNIGFDMSNVGGNNMGVFPGTGQLLRFDQEGQYADQHHVSLWTSTMIRHMDSTPAISARVLGMLPDGGQPDIPDPNYPDVKGRYIYDPLGSGYTHETNGCRCIKDPLFVTNNYDFPTEYFSEHLFYAEGLNNPNSYQIVKTSTVSNIEIPVSKAFSAQSLLLNNTSILNSTNFNNLKANVLWSDNMSLINKVSIINPSPGSLSSLSSSNIKVEVNPNQTGNAVVTLHNGSITNPVYWSWHIWVTDSEIASYDYLTEPRNINAENYINYIRKGPILKTEFMDRHLGATDAFPTSIANPINPTAAELSKVRASTGLHYQWGRKDPFPAFRYADNRSNYNVFLGNVDASGNVAYTTLTEADFSAIGGNHMITFDEYTNSSNANIQPTDKIAEKIAKVFSYSVAKPLSFMVPSTFSPFNTTEPDYTLGTDWLASEPGLAPERWGRGGEKSPFDPCPQGWRIPDVSATSIEPNQDFGLSPWYKKDLYSATYYNIVSQFLGTRVSIPSSSAAIGYMFNNSSYNLGGYPNSGGRGLRNIIVAGSTSEPYNTVSYQYPGIWTAALDASRGRPIKIGFNTVDDQMAAYGEDVDPYFGMSCRCIKIKYDIYGNVEGVIPRLHVTPSSGGGTLPTHEIPGSEILKKDAVLFPNPVTSLLYIDAQKGQEYSYQLFDMSGKMIKADKFNGDQTNLSSVPAGVYLIKISNTDKVYKIIKK